MAIRYWLGVANRDNVLRGVAMGMAQSSHGPRAPQNALNTADGLVYYSPRADAEGESLKEFTAIGWVAERPMPMPGDRYGDPDAWRSSRVAVDYDLDAVAASIRPLLNVLDLTRHDKDWGYQLRRGLLEITRNDFDVIRRQMRRDTLSIR